MEILKNCKIYPLSKFYKPNYQYYQLPPGIKPNENLDTSKISKLHLIEYGFEITPLKRSLLTTMLMMEDVGNVLIIDIVSIWLGTIEMMNMKQKKKINYLNCISNIKELNNFLSQLIETPIVALRRCQQFENVDEVIQRRLDGIFIDNVSYLQDFNEDQKGNSQMYDELNKMIRKVREVFGCWVVSISYGNEYYEGVEGCLNVKSHSISGVPISFLNGMDMIVLRESEGMGRVIRS
ncbi:hypothetical protein TBLA_0A08160 [Henningerozyma blattae CBS 6284]|uniref:DNA recombination and repair protein Rad51-like C-terminal domain-containing protein n=1 Tax=Henningerozyma blattae (strain ATCC 34711 / CBS 6284 / DSM 70876 / NBRC 10599 / NRRL Y-10934 / UCD 77-7) TaxID=1071380 RepID=I2GWV4_HENB6|nr:hypothetical protein TBLA_0A08160 [Tetrapisispora blattae CBS 6284]CCH58606.1 hypothetical protein TBLA_0A08160 [Tetrapisispora blattae CBS 6284]